MTTAGGQGQPGQCGHCCAPAHPTQHSPQHCPQSHVSGVLPHIPLLCQLRPSSMRTWYRMHVALNTSNSMGCFFRENYPCKPKSPQCMALLDALCRGTLGCILIAVPWRHQSQTSSPGAPHSTASTHHLCAVFACIQPYAALLTLGRKGCRPGVATQGVWVGLVPVVGLGVGAEGREE